METPWQLAWVRDRLVPRWTVERRSGRRAPRIRVLFVETPPDEIEVVARSIREALGHGWTVKVEVLPALGSRRLEGPPIDLVWALAWHAGLSPCGSPGVFLSYAWAEPLPSAGREPEVWSAGIDGIRSEREIRELERDNVVRALECTDWKIAGRDGAASLLGIHPSTLRDRMRAFGIARVR
jgi:hypothetical protein